MKIAVAVESGVSLLEVIALEDSWMHEEVFFLTTPSAQSKRLEKSYRVVYAKKVGSNPLLLIKSLLDGLALALKSRPDIVIGIPLSTTFGFMLFAKLTGAKLVAIEPFSHSHNSSIFSSILYKFSDIFFVQWEDMLDKYPKAEYLGSVY